MKQVLPGAGCLPHVAAAGVSAAGSRSIATAKAPGSDVAVQLELSRQCVAHTAGVAKPLTLHDASLLAWLALEGPTTRNRLAQLLWPDSDPSDARNSLRQRLFKIRKQLGTEAVAGSATLTLAEGVTHDLDAADQVLGDSAPVAAGEFAAWLAQQRQRRHGRMRQSLVELAQMAETAGDGADALSHAQELLALEPLSEDAHRRVMRVHYLAGDRAAALLAFDRCEQVLKDDVGTQPDAQTLALLRHIERSELSEPVVGRIMPPALLRPPRLVGRTHAWARLGDAWRAGMPVMVRGEGGMGKSRLLADFAQARRAQDPSAVIVSVGARPGDSERAFGLASRMLRAAIAVPGWTAPASVQRVLACLLPELGEPAPASADDELRLANAVETALAAAAQAGLAAIVVDDLHWSDKESLNLLKAASGGHSLRWLIATRLVEGGESAAEWQSQWLGSSRAIVIDLLPLSEDEVAELLDSLALAGAQNRWTPASLHQRSGGNPMFLLECLKASWGTVAEIGTPPSRDTQHGLLPALPNWPAVPVVQRQIAQRLLRFSPMAVRLVRCAAVAGGDFSAGLAAAVLQVRPLDLADAWAELEAAQVLGGGAFAHDLVFEAALGSVPEPIARELHREIALALRAADAPPQRVAAHWLSAGLRANAVEPLLRAARAELAAMRAAQAERWFAQAGDILEQLGDPGGACDALLMAAEAQSAIGTHYGSYVERIAALAQTQEQRLFADVLRCATLLNQGQLDEAYRVATDGVGHARRGALVEVESEFEWSLFHVAWARGDLTQAIAHGERDLALKRILPEQGLRFDQTLGTGVLLSSLALALTNSGRFMDGRARHQEALEYVVKHRATYQQALSASNLMAAELAVGHLPAARGLGERIGKLIDEGLAHEHDRLHALNALGVLHSQDGRWGLAAQRLEELENAIEDRHSGYAPTLPVTRVSFLLAIGRRDMALQGLARLKGKLPEGPSMFRVVYDVYDCVANKPRGGQALLAPISAIGNVALRWRLLLALAPQLDAASVLPVLTLASSQVRDGGGWGFWLALQARRASVLARLGESESAASAAREAWARHLAGDWPMLLFPDFAADLADALQSADPMLTAVVVQRGRESLAEAAAGLDSPLRETCLERSPLLLRLAALHARLSAA